MGWEFGNGRAHFQWDDWEGFLEELEFEQSSDNEWEMNERDPNGDSAWRSRAAAPKPWGVGGWIAKRRTILVWQQDGGKDLGGDVFQKFRL